MKHQFYISSRHDRLRRLVHLIKNNIKIIGIVIFLAFLSTIIFKYSVKQLSPFIIIDVHNKNISRKLEKCIPKDLIGEVEVDDSIVEMSEAKKILRNFSIQRGGKRIPNCVYQTKVAIIIPFRNRSSQLATFLAHYHQILHRQNIFYQIFTIIQSEKMDFNRAKLFNIGYTESIHYDNFDCFIFHDVDFLLMNDKLIYNCLDSISHFGVSASQFQFKLPYVRFCGGVISISKNDFTGLNGFPNCYWGYGGEDDDFYRRVIVYKGKINRPDKNLGKYFSNKKNHNREIKTDLRNINTKYLGKANHQTMKADGLNSLYYSIIKVESLPLCVQITADLTPDINCSQIYN